MGAPLRGRSVDSRREVRDMTCRVVTTMTCVEGDIVRRAQAILRIMYDVDMREMQMQINDLLSVVQMYTANPKTSMKLGKVGR